MKRECWGKTDHRTWRINFIVPRRVYKLLFININQLIDYVRMLLSCQREWEKYGIRIKYKWPMYKSYEGQLDIRNNRSPEGIEG